MAQTHTPNAPHDPVDAAVDANADLPVLVGRDGHVVGIIAVAAMGTFVQGLLP